MTAQSGPPGLRRPAPTAREPWRLGLLPACQRALPPARQGGQRRGSATPREGDRRSTRISRGPMSFLSNTHGQDWINGWSGDRAQSLQLMRETAERAAALDPADGSFSSSLGGAYFAKDEVELGRRLGSAPGAELRTTRWSIARSGRSYRSLWASSMPQQGVELVERALEELDPFHPPFQYLSLGFRSTSPAAMPRPSRRWRRCPTRGSRCGSCWR